MFKTRYTPEELTNMQTDELDRLVEKLVIGNRPEPGIVRRIRNSWLRRYRQRSANMCIAYLPRQEVPEYSESYEGMGLIIETMQGKGYTITIEPIDKVRFAKDGNRTAYMLPSWRMDLPKTVAIAAVLVMQ